MQGHGRLKVFRVSKLGQFPITILDGEALSKHFDIVDFYLSPDGRYIAYTVSENGSEWQTLRIKNLVTGKDLREQLTGIRYVSISWKNDNSGFYYSTILKNDTLPIQKIVFHRLRTKQIKDIVIYENGDPDLFFTMGSTCGGKYLLLQTMRISSSLYSLRLILLNRIKTKALTILKEQNHTYYCVGWLNNTLYFITTTGASMGQLVALRDPNKAKQKPKFIKILAKQKALLRGAFIYPDYIIANYLTKHGTVLRRLNMTGKKLGETYFPEFTGITGWSRGNESEIFFKVEGYISPKNILLYKSKTDQLSQVAAATTSFDTSLYVTEKHYALSSDGTLVPVYLSFKKTLKRDSNNPVILTAYGGFDKSVQPSFSSYNIAWMELGGIFAEAILRGDGGCGHDWRLSGIKRKKQNTFDDFIGVAEYLIKEQFTSPAKLGIEGGSNGGLLVAVALAQRPKLFGAAVIRAGLLDMLRYHKFDFAYQYVAQYGCANNIKDFKVLHSYSPIHSIKKTDYPPVLVIAFANDDRVSPVHSFKFAGTLQNSQTGAAPVLLSVEANAGHAGHPSSNRGVDQISFFALCLGVSPQAIFFQKR